LGSCWYVETCIILLSHSILTYTFLANPPVNYGVLIYPSFEVLDLFGPISFLNFLSIKKPLNLSVIASTLDPVSTRLENPPVGASTSSVFFQTINPTHTFTNPPKDIEVLLLPGGPATRAPSPGGRDDAVQYIKEVYPKLRYIISVCTGVTILARAGILDGKHATGNKMAWAHVTSFGNNITWVPVARWVVDGNIWTTSGVSAGMDGLLGFIEHIYGREQALTSARMAEYEWHDDPSWDPFAALAGVPGANATQADVSSLQLSG
jgi:putative intracellular protease/amidase